MLSDNIDCSKMRSIAYVNVFERLYVSLGVITYLDTAKGLKTAYRAFFHEDTITDTWFFVCKGHYLGVWAFLSVVRYHYIPSTPKDAYTGKYWGIGGETHNHYCIFRWNTVSWVHRQQNRAVLVEWYQHLTKPSQRIFTVSNAMFYGSLSCTIMIAELKQNVNTEHSEYPLCSIFYVGRHNRT